MVRRKTLASAILGIFASQAFALGLGNIRIKSYLDQPLDAEIEVIASSPQELASLRVMLAPPEAYARAGIPRAHFHSKLRFRVEKRPDGKAVIHVTSKVPVKEPFLDFLVEANWGSGQIVREYTLLVDPPVLMQAPAPVVKAPAVSPVASKPATPATATSRRVMGSPAPSAQATAGTAPGTYGPTKRNETLWRIAERVRPSPDLTIPQVMLAILEANPEAFYNANINNLKAGYVLRIPTREEMQAIGRAEAAREFRRQMAEWRSGAARPGAGRSTVAGAEGAAKPKGGAGKAAADEGGSEEARLELVAPTESAEGEGTDAAAAATGVVTGEGQSIEALKKELTLANEAIEAQEQQNAQLTERLRRLEEQVEKLHRLLELKDSELARLQQSATPAEIPGDVGQAPSVPETAGPAGESGEMSEAPGSVEAGEPVVESAPAASETAPTPAGSAAGMEETILPDEELTAGDEDVPFAERLLRDPVYQAVGGGILLFLLLLLWMARRGRQAQEVGFEESILRERPALEPDTTTAEAAASVEAPVAETGTETREAAGPQTDSSLFTDFAVSGMDTMREEAEADPLAEADVYLAYGRYQQAEELIRSVIDKEPENPDLRVKLLEVLYAARNRADFDAEAEALLAMLGNPDDVRWQRVVEMGQDLSPDNPLFSGQAAAAENVEPVAESSETLGDVETVPTEPGQAEAEPAELSEAEPEPELQVLDMEAERKSAEESSEEALEADITPPSMPAAELPEEEGALAPLDEVATKLDLARAYMEMGDPEGARSILQEVLEEGSREQKEEAETLLREVG